MRLQRESFVEIVYLCREIVASYSRTSLQLSHSSEIGALKGLHMHMINLARFLQLNLKEIAETGMYKGRFT